MYRSLKQSSVNHTVVTLVAVLLRSL